MTTEKKAEIDARTERTMKRRRIAEQTEVDLAKAIAGAEALLAMDRDQIRMSESVGDFEVRLARAILLSKRIVRSLNEAASYSNSGFSYNEVPTDAECRELAERIWKSGQ